LFQLSDGQFEAHSNDSYQDPSPNFDLCVLSQQYYLHHSLSTQVLVASLTSAAECMSLAGASHITIPSTLLRELAVTPAALPVPSLFDDPALTCKPVSPKSTWLDAEAKYRFAFTRANNGKEEAKLSQAINIFCDMQDQLEGAMKTILQA
jgi:transaldolase